MDLTPEYKTRLVREMRRSSTESEARLWTLLRSGRLGGLKFRRQHPIGRFIADFYCDAARLVVEVDGPYHFTHEQRELDREREAHFTGRGLRILRVTDQDVLTNAPAVLQRIEEEAARPPTTTQPDPLHAKQHPPPAPGTPLPATGRRAEAEGIPNQD